jgi:hypothetical protein
MSTNSQPSDPVDRELFVVHSGTPHTTAILHLTETHSLPATASHLLDGLEKGQKDPDTARMLNAIRRHRDAEPGSPTYACYKWYVEDPVICDTNASFFVCTPLAGAWLAHRGALTAAEQAELRAVFADVLPWFARMAEAPSLFYPNKCLSDAAMLLAAGHILGEPDTIAAGQAFCRRYFDYYARRGTGWGEDHSPVYVTVMLEMTLLIMALEKRGPLFDQAKAMTNTILEWVAFHAGVDAVPSIRGYNFECRIRPDYRVAGLIAGNTAAALPPMLALLRKSCGYSFAAPPVSTPRERSWRTFDAHFSTSYIGPHARLGTLSYYPLMPNSYMHDAWGLGWQSKPYSFIVGEEEYGVLEWSSEDDMGLVRQHEANGTIHDWPSRHLFKRVSFHPEVVSVGHQDGAAAIVLREIHRLHSPTRRITDRWRLAYAAGRILIGGREWDGRPTEAPAQWLVLRYPQCCVALRPLKCRILDPADDDRNPQRRTTGTVVDLPVRIEKTDRGVCLSRVLVDGHTGTITQHLLFSGWCVVLLDRPDDVAELSVTETFHEDGEVPRTYGELIRTVELTTPTRQLRLVRDMLTGDVQRFSRHPEANPTVRSR